MLMEETKEESLVEQFHLHGGGNKDTHSTTILFYCHASLTTTTKNMTALAMKIDRIKVQSTTVRSRRQSEPKTSAGSAKLDTKVLIPLHSDEDTMPKRPAMYPRKIIPKHSTSAG